MCLHLFPSCRSWGRFSQRRRNPSRCSISGFRGWVPVISGRHSHWKTWSSESQGDSEEIWICTRCKWTVLEDFCCLTHWKWVLFSEDRRELLVKLQVGSRQHPWACSQLPLVNNCLGFSSSFQVLHEYLSLWDWKLEPFELGIQGNLDPGFSTNIEIDAENTELLKAILRETQSPSQEKLERNICRS